MAKEFCVHMSWRSGLNNKQLKAKGVVGPAACRPSLLDQPVQLLFFSCNSPIGCLEDIVLSDKAAFSKFNLIYNRFYIVFCYPFFILLNNQRNNERHVAHLIGSGNRSLQTSAIPTHRFCQL